MNNSKAEVFFEEVEIAIAVEQRVSAGDAKSAMRQSMVLRTVWPARSEKR